MSPTIFRYALRTYLGSFFGILCAVLAVFLVGDFVDRSDAYTGDGWVTDAALLYFYKALVAVQQLAPAALLLGAGITVSTIRKRGELTALRALSFGPAAVYLPIGAAALALCSLLVVFEETVVLNAGRRVDEISTQRFNRWGDWRFYFQPKQWFRKGDRVFFLREGTVEDGYRNVTVLELTSDFQLVGRIDALTMQVVDGSRWRLTGVVERSFDPGGTTRLEKYDTHDYDLGAEPRAFRILQGRPAQMGVPALREQIRARREVGLPTHQFSLALHNRFAYSLAGFPAALLAIGLAIRPDRKGHLTAAIVEGLLVTVLLWGMMVVSRTLVNSEHLAPFFAAWLPTVVLVSASFTLWMKAEGRSLLPRGAR